MLLNLSLEPSQKQEILNDSNFDSIRSDSRFIELINQTRLPTSLRTYPENVRSLRPTIKQAAIWTKPK